MHSWIKIFAAAVLIWSAGAITPASAAKQPNLESEADIVVRFDDAQHLLISQRFLRGPRKFRRFRGRHRRLRGLQRRQLRKLQRRQIRQLRRRERRIRQRQLRGGKGIPPSIAATRARRALRGGKLLDVTREGPVYRVKIKKGGRIFVIFVDVGSGRVLDY